MIQSARAKGLCSFGPTRFSPLWRRGLTTAHVPSSVSTIRGHAVHPLSLTSVRLAIQGLHQSPMDIDTDGTDV